MLNVQYQAPGDDLALLISSFYRLDYKGASFSEVERADRAQFRFHLVGGGSYHFATGFVSRSYPVMITGPTSGPVKAVSDGTLNIFGWGMTHAGWAALMGKNAEARVDTAFDAREIFGDRIMELRDQLIANTDFGRQVDIGSQTAREIYCHTDAAPFEFTQKVDAWLAEHIDPDVQILAAATGLSPRQLERMTNRYYGMPPKKLARKYRALRAAQALAHGDSLDDTGMALAFYDQSHLIRELKAFTGLTPSQLKSGNSQLTRATMDGRRSLIGKVSPLISES
jgi:AraC-like DNA-binding protein